MGNLEGVSHWVPPPFLQRSTVVSTGVVRIFSIFFMTIVIEISLRHDPVTSIGIVDVIVGI